MIDMVKFNIAVSKFLLSETRSVGSNFGKVVCLIGAAMYFSYHIGSFNVASFCRYATMHFASSDESLKM